MSFIPLRMSLLSWYACRHDILQALVECWGSLQKTSDLVIYQSALVITNCPVFLGYQMLQHSHVVLFEMSSDNHCQWVETSLFWVRTKPLNCPRRCFVYCVLGIDVWVTFEVKTHRYSWWRSWMKVCSDVMDHLHLGLYCCYIVVCGTGFQSQEFQLITCYGPEFMGNLIQDETVWKYGCIDVTQNLNVWLLLGEGSSCGNLQCRLLSMVLWSYGR